MTEPNKAGGQGDGDAGSKSAGDNGQITVKVGEENRTLKSEEVVNLLNQQAGVTQEGQKIASIRDAASKYGMEAEDYVKQAEGSFGALTKLFDAGMIDKDGNILKGPDKVEGNDDGSNAGNVVVKDTGSTGAGSVDEAVGASEKRMGKTIEVLTKTVEGLTKSVENTMKLGLKREVMHKHPELSEGDVLNVLDFAQANPNKNLWDHAKDAVDAKKTRGQELDERYAKKYGVDLDAWNARNNLNEQGADGGGAAAVVTGKKVTFGAKRGDKNAVSPKQATLEFMKNLGR